MILKTICLHSSVAGPSVHYRAVLPARFCGPDLEKLGVKLQLTSKLFFNQHPHGLMLYRGSDPKGYLLFSLYRYRGTVIVHDLDDYTEAIPEYFLGRKEDSMQDFLNAVRAGQGIAHLRTASSEYLSRKLGGVNFVLPNLIDLEEYKPLPPRNDGKIRIMWAGGSSHDLDLQLMIEPLRTVLRKYAGKVTVMFWGDYQSDLIAEFQGKGCVFIPGVPMGSYAENLCRFQPDIGICPLQDTEFTRSKSPIKAMEMSAAGAAVLCSEVEPYLPWCSGKVDCGCRDADEWTEKLCELIEDADARAENANCSRWITETGASWQKSSGRQAWLEFFKTLAELKVERWPAIA